MSTTSKAVLGLSVLVTAGTVVAVHLKQRLHEGVLRDLERVERKKRNVRLLEENGKLSALEADAIRRESVFR
uniref:PET117 cytochrome c oxidase chaperone n=1 Tax=Hippocampus comes TaxID=109280 RepID=A0A3Q3DXQ6_HIPCM